MKKILSLALVLVMVLGLAACGSNGSTASTTPAAYSCQWIPSAIQSPHLFL